MTLLHLMGMYFGPRGVPTESEWFIYISDGLNQSTTTKGLATYQFSLRSIRNTSVVKSIRTFQ